MAFSPRSILPGELDLLVPREEQDAAHLPEIDLDQVGGLLDVLRRVQALAVPAVAVLRLAQPRPEGAASDAGEGLLLVREELAPGVPGMSWRSSSFLYLN